MDATGLPGRLIARLTRGRAAAQARMLDTCLITRDGEGDGPFNHDTGQHDDPPPVTIYEGPCYIPKRDAATSSSDAGAGEASWQIGEYGLALPIGADPRIVAGASEDVHLGHTVTYLTSALDPHLVGNEYGITAVPDQSQATSRRFRMKRVVGS